MLPFLPALPQIRLVLGERRVTRTAARRWRQVCHRQVSGYRAAGETQRRGDLALVAPERSASPHLLIERLTTGGGRRVGGCRRCGPCLFGGRGFGGGAPGGILLLEELFQRIHQVPQQMPAIGDLSGFRGAVPSPFGIVPT